MRDRRPALIRSGLVAIGLALVAAVVVSRSSGDTRASAAQPTYAHDVARVLNTHCVQCHHPNGPGPFSLLTYGDARRRARQIARVTARRFMPPWLPDPGHVPIVGENRLSPDEIAMLGHWAAAGAPEGEPGEAPAAPAFAAGWQLGAPDLVLTAKEPFVLHAEGSDVFWNLVLPATVTDTRWVRAMEILPGNRRVVHHANVLLDRSGMGRARDAEFPGPGFPGMDIEIASNRFEPDSHFLFWKPGTPALVEPPDMAWRLEPGTDLILNLHLQPSGKEETIAPSIGLYFSERPATRVPMLLQLEHDGALDIPAGDPAFAVTDQLMLPVPVTVLGMYPHAHYLGTRFEGSARLPDGSVRRLVTISHWDLNWQGVYQFVDPLALPQGTVLTMRWVYDNTAGNVRNPSSPPIRVRGGNRATDEMAHLWVQVLTERPEDRLVLQEALMRARLQKYPGDFVALANLGSALQTEGRLDDAVPLLRQAVAARPDHAPARNNLATALRAAGRIDEAIAEFEETLRRQPAYVDAEYNLATALLESGRTAEAIDRLRHVLQVHPADAAAMSDLGAAYAIAGRYDAAVPMLERSLELAPANAQAHFNLGLIAGMRGDTQGAVSHFEAALGLDPENKEIAQALREAKGQR